MKHRRATRTTTPGHSPGEAAHRHVAGRTAQSAPGQGSDTAASSSWLAEREGAGGQPPPGVPIDLAPRKPPQVIEARRGKHRSG